MGKVVIISVLVLILLGVAGGGYYLTTQQKNSAMPQTAIKQNPTPLASVQNTEVGTSTSQTADTQTTATSYSLSEIATHNSASSCWLVISNKVYDVTTFIPEHPGGNEILKACGRDATSMFSREREHQENNAAALLPEYFIGDLSN